MLTAGGNVDEVIARSASIRRQTKRVGIASTTVIHLASKHYLSTLGIELITDLRALPVVALPQSTPAAVCILPVQVHLSTLGARLLTGIDTLIVDTHLIGRTLLARIEHICIRIGVDTHIRIIATVACRLFRLRDRTTHQHQGRNNHPQWKLMLH